MAMHDRIGGRAASTGPWRQTVGLNRARIGGTPSYVHRFRIGIFDAAIASDGPLILPEPAEIFSGLSRPAIEQALEAGFVPPGPVRVEQNCLLLDLGGHLVLIDNGMGSSDRFGPHAGRLEQSLAELGLEPGHIDAMVLSHLHPDHCWGTMCDDGTPRFPNAQLYISEEELSSWNARLGEDSISVEGFRRHILPLRDRILFFRDGEEFLPSLHALLAPGHTPGHSVFVVASAGEEMCVLGDVAFHDPLSFAHPTVHSAYDQDAEQGAATRLHLLGRLADERMRLVSYHQPWPGIGHVVRHGGAFRYQPAHTAPDPATI
jgi:glyoxylase-like metal-dependent hydrolase (beta-lactamase superfamily II)